MRTHIPKVLSRAALEIIASRFKILAEPTRLELLHALQQGELNVGELVERTGASQANVSKHLGLMLDAGMVGRRRHGTNVYYFISDPTIFDLCDLMCSRLQRELDERAAALSGGAPV